MEEKFTRDAEEKYKAALALTNFGISLLPIRDDGSKAFAIPDYQKYFAVIVDPETLRRWIQAGHLIGVLTGKASGNLQVLIFGSVGFFKSFIAVVDSRGQFNRLGKMAIVKTPGGGIHLYYRCKVEVAETQVLARRNGHSAVKEEHIKALKEGSCVVVPGFGNYEKVSGDFSDLPVLSPEDRAALIDAARSLNESENPGGEDSNQENDSHKPVQRVPDQEESVEAPAPPPLETPVAPNVEPPEVGKAAIEEARTISSADGFEGPHPGWPAPLGAAAFHGLAGEIVRILEPHTEADPVALLVQFLVAVGNCIGRTAYLMGGSARHYLNLFVAVVGDTAMARKGESWNCLKNNLLVKLAPEWLKDRVKNGGLASGEGLIHAVRDPGGQLAPPVKGSSVLQWTDPGASDKRLLVVEPEFSSILKVMGRDKSILSETLRNAWDSGELNNLTKTNSITATGAYISIIAHITKYELEQSLTKTDLFNGFVNRFLWTVVRRSKSLPFPGTPDERDLAPLLDRLAKTLEFARSVECITFHDDVRSFWTETYRGLCVGRTGILDSVTARSVPQVLRIASIYALLDFSKAIRRDHLLAALEVWRYCKDSCRYLFGDELENPLAQDVLALFKPPVVSMTKTEMHKALGGHTKAKDLNEALKLLRTAGKLNCESVQTNGREAEAWMLVKDAKEDSSGD
jgi:hypothetical protein